jgi:hypothetical protein
LLVGDVALSEGGTSGGDDEMLIVGVVFGDEFQKLLVEERKISLYMFAISASMCVLPARDFFGEVSDDLLCVDGRRECLLDRRFWILARLVSPMRVPSVAESARFNPTSGSLSRLGDASMAGSVLMPATGCEIVRVLLCERNVGDMPSDCVLAPSDGGSGVAGAIDARTIPDDRGVPAGVLDLRVFFRRFIDFTACKDGSRASRAWR